jgi:hypothetical protein
MSFVVRTVLGESQLSIPVLLRVDCCLPSTLPLYGYSDSAAGVVHLTSASKSSRVNRVIPCPRSPKFALPLNPSAFGFEPDRSVVRLNNPRNPENGTVAVAISSISHYFL